MIELVCLLTCTDARRFIHRREPWKRNHPETAYSVNDTLNGLSPLQRHFGLVRIHEIVIIDRFSSWTKVQLLQRKWIFFKKVSAKPPP